MRSFIKIKNMEIENSNQLEPKWGTLIGAREKVNLMAQKILLYVYYHNKLILDFTELHAKFGGDLKKYLEIIMIMEGIGFVQRINKTEIVFKGFKGFILKFNSNFFIFPKFENFHYFSLFFSFFYFFRLC